MSNIEAGIIAAAKEVDAQMAALLAQGYSGNDQESNMMSIRDRIGTTQSKLFALMREFLGGNKPDPAKEEELRGILEGPMGERLYFSQTASGKVENLMKEFRKDYVIIFK